MGWIQRLQNLTRQSRLDQDIDREFAFHVAEKIDELVAAGMTEKQARLEANRVFGNRTIQKEKTRDNDIPAWIESVGQDVHYGFRMMRRNPIFTLIVVASLAIGIGANATLFSLIDAMFFRTLPVEQPNELVYFKWAARSSNWMALGISGNTNTDPETREVTSTAFSYTTFQQFREHTQTLSDVFAVLPMDEVNVSVDAHASLADGQLVSGNYFTGLQVHTVLGRAFTDDDDRKLNPVVVISYRYWERQFDRNPEVLGKEMTLNGIPVTIIGVASRGFVGVEGFAGPRDIFVPLALYPRLFGRPLTDLPWRWFVPMMGRMKPGVTLPQVRADLERIFLSSARDAWNAAPASARNGRPAQTETPRLLTLAGSHGLEENVSSPWKIVGPMIAIAVTVLLIVCLNVANLLLARTAARQSEVSIRLAVGGSRIRVVRQLLTEIVMMSLLAAGLSIPLAQWARGLIVSVLPATDYDLRIDSRTLIFTVFIAVVAGIAMGLASTLRATRGKINRSLKETSRTLIGPKTRLSRILLVVQVALSITLVVGAGLFVRTIQNLRNVDVGFDTSHILLFRVNPGALKYEKTRIEVLYTQIVDRVSAIPGVRGVTFSSSPPVSKSGSSGRLYRAGTQLPNQLDNVRIVRIRSNFLGVLGTPVLAGRDLQSSDTSASPQVALINEALASRMFPTENPVGQQVGGQEHSTEIQVTGVTKDIGGPVREVVPPTIYLPDTQAIPNAVTFVIRTAAEPALLASAIREAVRGVDSDVPVVGIQTEAEQIESTFILERVFATATTFFGGVALILACIGLFGLMSYTVERRTNEIGVRMALGATRIDVVVMIMRQTLTLVLSGMIVGFGASLAAGTFIAKLPFLYKVSSHDPISLGIALAAMLAVAFIATYLPARRASQVDPSVSLRSE